MRATSATARPGGKLHSPCWKSSNRSRFLATEEDLANIDLLDYSIHSIDNLLASEDVDVPADEWKAELTDRMLQITDPKRSNAIGRQDAFAAYTRILMMHYVRAEVQPRARELIPAMLKVVKAESNERDTAMALKGRAKVLLATMIARLHQSLALAVTVITSPSDTTHDTLFPQLRRAILDSQSILIKTGAIHTLGATTFYGDASEEDVEQVLEFLLEIIQSDGNSAGAGDEGEVVASALEEWGFLATQVEDMEEATESAMDAFVEQLDSSDLAVQVAAGENIALLYEKSHTPLEDDEDPPSSDDESSAEDDGALPNGLKMVKRYNVYRQEHQLKRTLANLATVSSRGISKKDKKSLHTNFSDILHSVENPTHGPRYRTALNQETGQRYGSRLTMRINRSGEIRIDQWWKLHRLKALRRVLQGGLVTHYEQNEIVSDSLP